jgi:hypothetical protein
MRQKFDPLIHNIAAYIETATETEWDQSKTGENITIWPKQKSGQSRRPGTGR